MKNLIGIILSPFLGLLLLWWLFFLIVVHLPVHFLNALEEGIPAVWQRLANSNLPLSEKVETDKKILRLCGWLFWITILVVPIIYLLAYIAPRPKQMEAALEEFRGIENGIGVE